jgi:hypothetical protein
MQEITLNNLVENEGPIAIYRDGLRWNILARCVRELSGRIGVHCIATYVTPNVVTDKRRHATPLRLIVTA